MEFYTQPQHETEMALYEEWVKWITSVETSEMSLPKITLPLTDVPF